VSSTPGPFAAVSRLVTSPHTRTPVFLAIAALVTAIAAGLTFRRAITPWSSLPDSDYWGNISGLITESGVRLTLANLFRHNNEHIVVIPKLIYAANYLATSGSNTGLIVYSLVLGIACTGLLLVLARETLLDTPWRLVLCALLFPLVMFSAKLTHSYFLGMSGTIWLTADLFVIVSAAALARAVASKSANWLLVSLAAGVLGVLAYSTAIYMLIVLVIFCLAKLLRPKLPGPDSRPLLLGTLAAALLVLGLGVAFRNAPKAKPDLAFDLVGLVEFVLIYLGNALTTGPLRIVAGLLILAAGAASIWRLAAERRIEETLLWVILFFFASGASATASRSRRRAATSRSPPSRSSPPSCSCSLPCRPVQFLAAPRGGERLPSARFSPAGPESPLTGPMSPTTRRAMSGKSLPKLLCGRGSKAISISKPRPRPFPSWSGRSPCFAPPGMPLFIGGHVAKRGSGSTSPSGPAPRPDTSRHCRYIRCPAVTAPRLNCPAGRNAMAWRQSASFWPTAPARRLAREPSSRAVPM
jgi:hypothetical protein